MAKGWAEALPLSEWIVQALLGTLKKSARITQSYSSPVCVVFITRSRIDKPLPAA